VSSHAHPDTSRGQRRFRLDRLVYGTVVLMSVLAVYDGWQGLATFLGIVAVILAPLLALAVAHLFAEVLHAISELARPLTRAEWKHHVLDQGPWFLAALPPLVMLGIGWVSPLDALSTITLVLWTAVITLVAIAAVAGRRAGLTGWRWLLTAATGGLVGLIVIALQVLLKPH
jgi:hypothetical protein